MVLWNTNHWNFKFILVAVALAQATTPSTVLFDVDEYPVRATSGYLVAKDGLAQSYSPICAEEIHESGLDKACNVFGY